MPSETLQLNYPCHRRENRIKDRPLKRLIVFLVVLVGISIAIAAHSKKEPARYISMA